MPIYAESLDAPVTWRSKSQRYRELRSGLDEFYEAELFERDCSRT